MYRDKFFARFTRFLVIFLIIFAFGLLSSGGCDDGDDDSSPPPAPGPVDFGEYVLGTDKWHIDFDNAAFEAARQGDGGGTRHFSSAQDRVERAGGGGGFRFLRRE